MHHVSTRSQTANHGTAQCDLGMPAELENRVLVSHGRGTIRRGVSATNAPDEVKCISSLSSHKEYVMGCFIHLISHIRRYFCNVQCGDRVTVKSPNTSNSSSSSNGDINKGLLYFLGGGASRIRKNVTNLRSPGLS